MLKRIIELLLKIIEAVIDWLRRLLFSEDSFFSEDSLKDFANNLLAFLSNYVESAIYHIKSVFLHLLQ